MKKMIGLISIVFLMLIGVYLIDRHPACEILTEDDLILRVVQHLVENPHSYTLTGNADELRRIRETIYPYVSVEDFLIENPDCCRFSNSGRDGFRPNLITRLRMDIEGYVIIDYRIRTNEDGIVTYHQVWGIDAAISSCGELVNL